MDKKTRFLLVFFLLDVAIGVWSRISLSTGYSKNNYININRYIYIKIYKHFIVKTVISKVSWLQCFLCDVFWIWQQISVKWLHCVGHGFGRPPNVAATLQPEWPGWSVTVRSDYLPLARTVMGFLYFWWISVHFYIATCLSMAKLSLICATHFESWIKPILYYTQIHPVKFQIPAILFFVVEKIAFFSVFDFRWSEVPFPRCHNLREIRDCANPSKKSS